MDLTNLNKDRKDRRKSGSLDLGTMMYGKVPPQSKDLEEAVLGAIMLEKSAFDFVSEILKPDCFYVEAHQRIFRACQGLQQKNLPIDILTVVEELKFREELDIVGGPYYVSKLTNSVNSSANIVAHSRIIMQKFIQREIIRIGGIMIGDAYEDSTDVFELLDEVESHVFGITSSYLKSDYSHISKGLVKVVERIEHLRTLDETVTGVPSDYPELDKVIHGWQPSDLIILAARPSVGKTAFALNLARNASKHFQKPTPVGFFSLEMSESQLIQRILSTESNIWLERIATGKLGETDMKVIYKDGVQPLSNAPIYIDDTAAINIFELRAKARRMKKKHNVGLIIIDYLQLMSGPDKNKGGNREQEISKISRDLKEMAKDLELPVIALSQLSRDVEKRGKGMKEPVLSDLRESGAIEQDADVVMFLYRPPDDDVKEDAELANKGLVKIAKHRNGKLEQFVFHVDNSVQRWTEKGVVNSFGTTSSGLIPVDKANADQQKLYIQKGSKMNDGEFDDEPPF